jgi:hypothetical protein
MQTNLFIMRGTFSLTIFKVNCKPMYNKTIQYNHFNTRHTSHSHAHREREREREREGAWVDAYTQIHACARLQTKHARRVGGEKGRTRVSTRGETVVASPVADTQRERERERERKRRAVGAHTQREDDPWMHTQREGANARAHTHTYQQHTHREREKRGVGAHTQREDDPWVHTEREGANARTLTKAHAIHTCVSPVHTHRGKKRRPHTEREGRGWTVPVTQRKNFSERKRLLVLQ